MDSPTELRQRIWELTGMDSKTAMYMEDDTMKCGVTVDTPDGECHLTIPYPRNEDGVHAQSPDASWEIHFTELGVKINKYKTLGHVINFLNARFGELKTYNKAEEMFVLINELPKKQRFHLLELLYARYFDTPLGESPFKKS